MIKAVLFDLGGVILTDIFNELDLFFAKKAGVELPEYKKVRRKLWHKYELGRMTGIEFMTCLRERLNIPMNAEDMLNKSFELIELNDESLQIVKDLKGKGLKLGVITNNSEEWHNYEKNELGLGDYFDHWVSSSEKGIRKPCMELYQNAAKELGLAPEECIFIDNKQKNVDGAIRCGMKGVLFKDAGQLRSELRALGLEV